MLPQFNTAAMEAMCAGAYLEQFLNCVEQIPSELSGYVSELYELDAKIQNQMREMKDFNEIYNDVTADVNKKQKALAAVQKALVQSQEYWDEKLQIAAVIVDFIDSKQRQLTLNQENIDPTVANNKEKDEKPKVKDSKSTKHSDKVFPVIPKTSPTPPRSQDLPCTPSAATPSHSAAKASGASPVTASTASPPSTADVKSESTTQPNKLKRQRRQRTQDAAAKEEEKKEEEAQQPKKKKKRKAKNANKNFEKTLVGEPIDPDEPTYCLCEQVSYGDMIGCDNDSCVIEWFHFNCVSLTTKPKGKWYCPKCRGDRPNVKRSDLK